MDTERSLAVYLDKGILRLQIDTSGLRLETMSQLYDGERWVIQKIDRAQLRNLAELFNKALRLVEGV